MSNKVGLNYGLKYKSYIFFRQKSNDCCFWEGKRVCLALGIWAVHILCYVSHFFNGERSTVYIHRVAVPKCVAFGLNGWGGKRGQNFWAGPYSLSTLKIWLQGFCSEKGVTYCTIVVSDSPAAENTRDFSWYSTELTIMKLTIMRQLSTY